MVKQAQPSIAPLGEAVSNTELFRRLSARMGFEDSCLFESDEELIRQAFVWDDPRMNGITIDRLRAEGPLPVRQDPAPFRLGPPAPTGGPARRIQLAPPDGRFYVPPAENPDDETPNQPGLGLVLLSPPAHGFLNSTFANLDSARRHEKEPTVQVHPDDAAARGLTSGRMVDVHNDRGRFRARLEVTEAVRPGVACAPSIWWPTHTETARNANAVTSQVLTDVGRGATLYDCAVEVTPVER